MRYRGVVGSRWVLELRSADRMTNRLHAMQVFGYRGEVVIGHVMVCVHRHRRADDRAVRSCSIAQSRDDLALAPFANSCLAVGRYVGAEDMANIELAGGFEFDDGVIGAFREGIQRYRSIVAGRDERFGNAASQKRIGGHRPAIRQLIIS